MTVHPAHTLTNFHDNQVVVGKKLVHPTWFAQTPEKVAKAIVRASRKNKRDTIMTVSARLMRHFNHFLPGVMDRILTFGAKRYYKN
jgi:short-subunit dehydrogenase